MLICHLNIFFDEISVWSFAHFLIGLFVFLLLSFKSSLYRLDTSLLSHICFAKLFFLSVAYLFILLTIYFMCVCAKSLQSCLTLGNHMDHSPPGSCVHGILQARIWVAISSSRGSSWPMHFLHLLHLQVGSLPLAPLGKHSIFHRAVLNFNETELVKFFFHASCIWYI